MCLRTQLTISHSGGGIGGLTLAAALRHLGDQEKLDVHIYEASGALTEIGAGINFWPRTWRIMKEIGIQSRLTELLPTPPKEDMRKSMHPETQTDRPNKTHSSRRNYLQHAEGRPARGRLH